MLLTMSYYLSGSVTASVSPAPPIPGFSPTSVAERSLFASADTYQLRLHVLLAFRKVLSLDHFDLHFTHLYHIPVTPHQTTAIR